MAKHGKNPNRTQQKFLEQNGLDPKAWLVVKNQDHEMCVRNRETGEVRFLER